MINSIVSVYLLPLLKQFFLECLLCHTLWHTHTLNSSVRTVSRCLMYHPSFSATSDSHYNEDSQTSEIIIIWHSRPLSHHPYHHNIRVGRSMRAHAQGCARFAEFLQNFSEWTDFVEFVFGSFSCFCIQIAHSNFTFCGAWTPVSLSSHEKCPNFRKTRTSQRQVLVPKVFACPVPPPPKIFGQKAKSNHLRDCLRSCYSSTWFNCLTLKTRFHLTIVDSLSVDIFWQTSLRWRL